MKKPSGHHFDQIFFYFLRLSGWSLVIVLLFMMGSIFWMSLPTFKNSGLGFFVSQNWDVFKEDFGAWPFIYGTVVSSFVSLLLAVPVSIGVALFINELAPRWIAKPIGFFVEMLAAIPSIVFGLWGLYVLVPFLRDYVQPGLSLVFGWLPFFSGPPIGVGMMAASVVLAIMITPTISSICREVFASIPHSTREAALGLGATRWECLKLAVLKSSFPGILGATLLGLGRALGETMAVTMVIGNVAQVKASLFAPAQTMASLLANEYAEANSDAHLSALTAIGLCLFIIAIIMSLLAQLVVDRFHKKVHGR